MPDKFTETTRISYGSRISGSFGAIFFGILLLIGGAVLLWWNEARTIDQAQALEEGLSIVQPLETPTFDPQNNTKLIAVQGTLIGASLTDPMFSVTNDAVKLERHVQMYQWRENTSEQRHEKIDGSIEVEKTYEYVKDWSQIPINSSSFKHPTDHQNPEMPFRSQSFTANVKLGNFQLSQSMVGDLDGWTHLSITRFKSNLPQAQLATGYIYVGGNPHQPEIGDIKITYLYIPSEKDYTVIAKQDNRLLTPYTASNGNRIAFAKQGIHSPQELFSEAQSDNRFMAWLLRAIGLFVLFFSFILIMAPVQTILSIIPILGSVIGAGTFFIAILLTLLVGGGIIAIAWFAQRPLISFSILAAILLMVFLGKRRK
ncbi:TMEM43 family protein [Thiomicrorhabdus sp.]|uniref:TMEM43 family protein n=1 Tax=Thiomicrorhabdus sp. TaxID=2039724 RepID=UPI0029C6A60F|nr:TMEM43 family protein [Thiomicrorhabdus sp.]